MSTSASGSTTGYSLTNGSPRYGRYVDNVYFRDGQLLTGILSLLLYLIVATSLDAAGYVTNMALLIPVTLGAFVLGTLMSYSRFDGFFALAHSLFVGLAWIIFLMTGMVDDADITPFLESGIPEMQARAYYVLLQLLDWLDDALNDAASEDNFVFVFEIGFLIWWLTYLGVWAIFRYGYTWRAIVPAGIVLVINTYYAPESTLGFLVVFSLLTLVLLIRTNLAEHQLRWREHRVYFNPDIALDFLRNALYYCVIVLAIAWIAPGLGRNPQVRQVLTPVNERWQDATERMNRLYQGLNRQSRPGVAAFGRSLSLGGARNVSDNPVFEVAAPVGRYWRAVIYDTFTGRIWLNTDEQEAQYAPDEIIPVASWNLRQPITQTLTMLAPAGNVIFGAPDIRQADVPIDALVRSVEAAAIIPAAQTLEFSLARSRRSLEPGDKYTVISQYSLVTERALNQVGSDYPEDVRQRYLQLPENFSPRVAATAELVTANLDTAYAKSKAVEAFLRGYEYNDSIDAPPPDVDPVEYFLYDIKQGYCDYYATSMTVMLRSLGIPARTASGYAEGTFFDETRTYLVTERDAHTWVEVYFPSYGWIEFEPTAGESVLNRPRGEDPNGASGSDQSEADGAGQNNPQDEGFEDDPFADPDNFPIDEDFAANEGNSGRLPWWLWALITPVALGVIIFLIMRTRVMGPSAFAPDLIPILFERMQRWAGRLGLHPARTQTPFENAHRLSRAIPDGQPYIQEITDDYVRHRFSMQDQPADSATPRDGAEGDHLLTTWQRLQTIFVKAWLRKTFRLRRRRDPFALIDDKNTDHVP